MKSQEEIINDSIKCEMPPDDYNIIETNCFLSLKHLLVMYHNKQISPEKATKLKQKALVAYEKDKKQQEFWNSIYQEHIQHIKDTENARVKLHKMLNGKDEYNRPITEETLCETINTCMEIISTIFKGEFV